MDDEIASALSRLLLASGSPERAKEYLDAYISREEPSVLTSVSTPSMGSVDLRRSSSAVVLPPLFSSPTTNPWQEGDSAPIQVTRPTELPPHSDVASPQHEKYRDGAPFHTNTTRSLTDGSPVWGDDRSFKVSSPSTTSVRLHPDNRRTAKAHKLPLTYGLCSAPPPLSPVSMLSKTSDQLLPTHNSSRPPTRGSSRSNRDRNSEVEVIVSPSPSPKKSPRTHGTFPDGGNNGSRTHDLHPDLAALRSSGSLLSKADFEVVKSKIQADPDYVGELPYIRVSNPQYKITIVVHAPPKSSSGKWYQVSRGTAVGVFNHWGSVASATQGVTMAVHKSFGTRGGAIVAYQVALLKGEVFLMNENQAREENDA